MCPACMAAAAVVAAKVASLGGLTAYGMKTLLFRPETEPLTPETTNLGGPNEGTEDRQR
jgi:hypothetical protein